MARTDLASFNRIVFETLSPSATYHDNWHIAAICRRLKRVWRGETTRLIINGPPRSTKSTICSVTLPAFVLGNDPAKRIICISFSSDLAVNLGNQFREVMNSSVYRRLFPQTKISRFKNTETEFATTRMGYRMSASIEGSLTGRGGDIIILDDPIKPTDALRDRRREHLNSIFFNTILSRLDDMRTGAIIIVTHRLQEDDLAGRLLREQPGEWTTLILPAIAEQEEIIQIGEQQYHTRHRGDPLHAERMPLSLLESRRAEIGSEVFAAQYQQSPVPREGAMIKRAWSKRYDRLPERNSSARIIQSWDTAIKGSEQANYSVGTTWLYQDKRYYLIDVFRDRIDYPTLKLQATASARLHKPNVILVEDAGVGTALAKELHQAGLPAIAVRPQFDKRTRMSIQSSKFESGQVFLPTAASWLDDLEAELFSFPGSRYDDQIDSISQGLAYEIPFGGELMGDAAINGYTQLVEGLCFNRLFSGR
jgi:predicted phage terminase large subunit-like protein